jgi:lipopolysaccharide transport system permease protein
MKSSWAHLVEVFFVKLRFNLRSEVSRTYLGYAWWILEPALLVAVMYLVFGVFFGRNADNFIVFLTLGKVPFLWFSKSVTGCANALHGGRGLMAQVAISKAFFPMLVIFQCLFKQLFVFLLTLVFLILSGLKPGFEWFNLVFVAGVQFLLIIFCGLFVAAITAFILDFRYLITTGMMALMFASGIFYDYQRIILPEHRDLFLLNPLALLLKNYRQVLMDLQPPDWMPLLAVAAVSR